MESRNLIIFSLLLLPLSLLGETASDYVNRGAQEYIFGHDQKAEAEVATGLAKFPNDPELRDMSGLFRKKQQKPNNQSSKGQQNQQQQQQNQSSANQDQNSQDQSSQQMAKNQQQKDQQGKPGESPSPSEGKDQQQGNQPSPSPGQGENKSSEQDRQQSGKQEQPEGSPSPGSGEDQMPSPSPGEGEGQGESASPSPTASGSPQKKLAGEIRGANGAKQPPSQQNADAFSEIEPEQEGQMSEKQAELLLRSMKDEEARVQLDERKVRRRVYNDW